MCVVSLADGGVLALDLARHRIDHQTLDHRGPLDLLRSGMRLRSVIERVAPDVIYSFLAVSNVLCAAFLPKDARARLVWGVRASSLEGIDYGLVPRLVLKLERALSNRPQLIIANSIAGANYLSECGYPVGRVRVVENSIDTSTFQYSSALRQTTRTDLGVNEGQKVVVLVGRIDLIKGHETFVRAAAEVCAERDDVVFWSVGGGNLKLRAELQGLTQSLNIESRFLWHGEMREPSRLVALLCAADLALSASLSEGFPNVVAEAMACGLRVVGTDVGDTRRIVGESGECVRPSDPKAMRDAILRQLLCDQGREEVRRDFLNRFDPSELRSRHESLLANVRIEASAPGTP